jgi:hypothetical protein
MIVRSVVSILSAVAIAAAISDARAELAAWDHAKVSALSKQLVDAAAALNDTFYKQPVPTAGSAQSRGYARLKDEVRQIQREAKALNSKLEKQGDRNATLASYQKLMQTVNAARDDARGVFTGNDVAEKAAAARGVLNQLGPYYDPDFKELRPVAR